MTSSLKTSSNTPLRVDFIDSNRLGISGRIGLTIAPGKKDRARGWDRDLAADLARLRDEYATDVLASLMQPHEYELLKISDLHAQAKTAGIDVRSFPIVDVSVPKPTHMSEFLDLVTALVNAATSGKTVVIHCRGGLGRSGTVSACCLVQLGLGVEDAIKATRHARPGAIETAEQERWVTQFATALASRTSSLQRPRRRSHDEGAAETSSPRLNAFRGCLLGGALGDALGYPIEFWKTNKIVKECGEAAPASLLCDRGKLALISDDTQMTLFTAEGMIRAKNREEGKGICHPPSIIAFALLRWYETQGGHVREPFGDRGWLVAEPRLHASRAPGNTCMSALGALGQGKVKTDVPTVEKPQNNSKGCGAVMRVAPCGLGGSSREHAFELGRDSGVITHGHPSGYLSAAYFASLIWDLSRGRSLPDAMDLADELLAHERGHQEVRDIVARARSQARRGKPSTAQIEELGGGWTGEEALAIALLCTLTFDPDESRPLEQALWRAAAHSGDSDSTAAITGNLLGAMHGLSGLPLAWLDQLELRDVIDRVATDLYASVIQDDSPPGYPPN